MLNGLKEFSPKSLKALKERIHPREVSCLNSLSSEYEFNDYNIYGNFLQKRKKW